MVTGRCWAAGDKLGCFRRNLNTAEKSAIWFRPTSYKQKVGFGEPCCPAYYMTRDGFMLLVMGFTGAKALKTKVVFIITGCLW